MYSGITQGLFQVTYVVVKPNMLDYVVRLNPALIEKLNIGSSVNVDGVCQTVTKIDGVNVHFTAMEETLSRTTLRSLQEGRQVSIERSLRYGDEVGGHLLAGHVFGTAIVVACDRNDENLSMRFKCPAEWMKYIFPKGFIGVDGCSLTVGATEPEGLFTVHLIPETIRVTNFGNKRINDEVNIELDQQTVMIVDNLARILAQL